MCISSIVVPTIVLLIAMSGSVLSAELYSQVQSSPAAPIVVWNKAVPSDMAEISEYEKRSLEQNQNCDQIGCSRVISIDKPIGIKADKIIYICKIRIIENVGGPPYSCLPKIAFTNGGVYMGQGPNNEGAGWKGLEAFSLEIDGIDDLKKQAIVRSIISVLQSNPFSLSVTSKFTGNAIDGVSLQRRAQLVAGANLEWIYLGVVFGEQAKNGNVSTNMLIAVSDVVQVTDYNTIAEGKWYTPKSASDAVVSFFKTALLRDFDAICGGHTIPGQEVTMVSCGQ